MKKVQISKLILSRFEESGMTKGAQADKIDISVLHIHTFIEQESIEDAILSRNGGMF